MSVLSNSERGSISGFVVVLSMTFVACAGLAFDGGRMIAARAEATDAAENAAPPVPERSSMAPKRGK